jgi:hypothetical protein
VRRSAKFETPTSGSTGEWPRLIHWTFPSESATLYLRRAAFAAIPPTIHEYEIAPPRPFKPAWAIQIAPSRDPFRVPFDSRQSEENVVTGDGSDLTDKFREFVKMMARLLVPEDDVEDMLERRKEAALETGYPIEQVADEDVIANADDEFLCGETLTLWGLIRDARELLKSSGG